MTFFFHKFKNLATLELVATNAHFGAISANRNHKLIGTIYGSSYLFDEKNNISSLHDIIDIDKTMLVVNQTRNFLKTFTNEHTILWVNSQTMLDTKYFGHKLETDYGFSTFCWQQNTQFFYIDKKSCYGFLSNFLSYYYFPKKRMLRTTNSLLTRTNHNLQRKYRFDINLKKDSPDVIFFFDIDGYQLLLQEALNLGIPTIGFCSTDTTIKTVFPTYTIVVNTHAYIAKYLILYELFRILPTL